MFEPLSLSLSLSIKKKLIKNIFVQIYNGNTVGYSFNRPPVILLYQLCTLSSGVKE